MDSTQDFDQITRAPGNGYRADTAVTIRRNQTVLAQVSDPSACTYSLTGSTVYAKFVVLSINLLGDWLRDPLGPKLRQL